MKKMICFGLVMSMIGGTTAFAAEEPPIFMRGNEIFLQNPPIRQDGKWMVSVEDLERLTDTRTTEGKDTIVFHPSVMMAGMEFRRDITAYFLEEGVLLECADGSYRRLDTTGFFQGGLRYLPFREYAEAIGYEVTWGKLHAQDMIMLDGREMPELELDVEYDAKEKRIKGAIRNMEPQAFLYGEEFTIERRTKDGWERVRKAEPKNLDSVGLMIKGKREFSDGITQIERNIGEKLPQGEYRMGIPFSYRYFIQSQYADDLKRKIKEGDLQNIDWDHYYSSEWGEADFFFEGNAIESTNSLQKTTNYILYGTFTVK